MTVGEWILFHGKDVHGNEDPDQPIWLGWVMPNPAWGGQGVLRNMTGTAERYDMGIEVQNNEVAIYVQWYEKMDVNSDECKYRVNGTLPPSVSPKQSAFASYWVQDAAAAWRFQSCGKKSARI